MKSEDATIAYSRCGGCCDCGKYRQSLREIGNGIIEIVLGACVAVVAKDCVFAIAAVVLGRFCVLICIFIGFGTVPTSKGGFNKRELRS